MPLDPAIFEKLGAFYLGREVDAVTRTPTDTPVMYDARDLVTHGVVLGMTGSGKTGLCLSLLEEAAIDGVPALVVDPKGDIANLLLTFPELRGSDFAPWVNDDDARRAQQTPAAFAEAQAQLWQKGLAQWGQSGERIRKLREAVDLRIYTPGSNAGFPVSILSSLQAPPFEIVDDNELLSARIESTVSGLLSLVGIDADPLESREHVLLSNVLANAWRAGTSLDLAMLIAQVQEPPFAQVGVIDVDAFFPKKKRADLAMKLNHLLAAPGFANWLVGEPLDLARMMHNDSGRPRVCIFSIAHLSDAERMFFVTLLLNATIAWMRAQSGTTSLRALFYMDEIFGYLPPTASPSSKKPMLTLLKQARAFGLGVLLATQNPVDLDYKALANMGTWWLGRLQTERDKMRVLDGLEGALSSTGAAFDRGATERLLAGLEGRMFLMNNVHDARPVLMQSRWALSYLRGPLTRTQIKTLMDPLKGAATATPVTSSPSPTRAPTAPVAAVVEDVEAPEPAAPVTSSSEPARYLPVPAGTDPAACTYVRHMVGVALFSVVDKKTGAQTADKAVRLAPWSEATPAWDESLACTAPLSALASTPTPGVQLSSSSAPLPANTAKAFLDDVARNCGVDVLTCDALDARSKPGESERDFRVRLTQQAREARDAAVTTLRTKVDRELAQLEAARDRAAQAVSAQESEAMSAKLSTAVTLGETLLGVFMGRKTLSTRNVNHAASTARHASKAMREAGDVDAARQKLADAEQKLADKTAELQAELESVQAAHDVNALTLARTTLRPLKKDIVVKLVATAWVPV